MQNLRRGWQKGQSGNPGGKARGIERTIREAVAAYASTNPDGTILDGWAAISKRLTETALGLTEKAKVADEIAAAKFLFERVYGKAKETIEITEPSTEPQIDWSLVPLEKRKRLLAALDEVEQLAETVSADESQPQ